TGGGSLTGQDIRLRDTPTPAAPTGVFPSAFTSGALPDLYWDQTTTIFRSGCPGGTATWEITTALSGGSTLASGTMDQGTPGEYPGAVPTLYPYHGPAYGQTHVTCPGSPAADTVFFTMFVIPDAIVQNVDGAPISGARVTLLRSLSGLSGTFGRVPG